MTSEVVMKKPIQINVHRDRLNARLTDHCIQIRPVNQTILTLITFLHNVSDKSALEQTMFSFQR